MSGVALVSAGFERGVVSAAEIPAVAFVTILGVLAGALMAPYQHRMAACYLFVGVAVVFEASVSVGRLDWPCCTVIHVFDFIGTIIGGLVAWLITMMLRRYR